MQNKKFGGSFAGKGYYIALILCAVAIGISGYLYYRNVDSDPNDTPAVATDATEETGTATVPGGSTPTAPSVPRPTVPKDFKTAAPLTGETVMPYAMDCLTYNPTTRDWRTHNGVDIAAQEGTSVGAAAAGTVKSVFVSDTMGTTVVIEHEGGYTTPYASLDKTAAVKAGDKVTLGQTIGEVGQTALMEAALGYHVHFSVSCNGESVDPADFFALSN